MRINIYYGGRGLIDDPTIYVTNKIIEVLDELRVETKRYNLFEEKNGLSLLPKTLKECDAVILAASVEWLGIGGLLTQFLDCCWLYGDKEKISQLYMMPVVISSTYGERDAEFTLTKAWDTLGGIPLSGISAYVDNYVDFETNPNYTLLIEKKAEALYRSVSQKTKSFPTSTTAIKDTVNKTSSLNLTPQESEQLSVYVSDDKYVKKQKEDIEELAHLFKEMLGSSAENEKEEFIYDLKKKFHPMDDFKACYAFQISDTNRTLVVDVNGANLNCYYGQAENADVNAKATHEIMNNIVQGRMTFQRAFMSGAVTVKGNFKTIRSFDTIFTD
ncbi:MAG: SCP2 sterol-binding domain-containing protein [Lachnospiraceae bacterium]|nr:SCP2 sterol-binding domain-containing protein [Lachnospiraceae bacterium]